MGIWFRLHFLSFAVDLNPPSAWWKCGNPAFWFLAGFPRPVERVGNSLGEFSRISTGRHFHRAVHLAVLGAKRRPGSVHCGGCSCFLWGFFFRVWPKSPLSSPKSCARIAQGRRSQGLSTGDTLLFAQAFLPPRSLRMDSPRISMRWALCTSRSRMLSAKVGSPICSCHLATGSWLVRIVERV